MNGKGSKQRPTNKHRFDENFQAIDWTVKKSSEEWAKELAAKCEIIVMDPDGWDRKNFVHSWAERITKEEFVKRVTVSTCQFKADSFERIKNF